MSFNLKIENLSSNNIYINGVLVEKTFQSIEDHGTIELNITDMDGRVLWNGFVPCSEDLVFNQNYQITKGGTILPSKFRKICWRDYLLYFILIVFLIFVVSRVLK